MSRARVASVLHAALLVVLLSCTPNNTNDAVAQPERYSAGARCATADQCKSGMCQNGACSECNVDAECASGLRCQHVPVSEGRLNADAPAFTQCNATCATPCPATQYCPEGGDGKGDVFCINGPMPPYMPSTVSIDVRTAIEFSSDADLTFYAAASPIERTFAYEWTFGDGGMAAEKKVTHRFGVTGTYHVKLVVRDKTGATASDARDIKICARTGAACTTEDSCCLNPVSTCNPTTKLCP